MLEIFGVRSIHLYRGDTIVWGYTIPESKPSRAEYRTKESPSSPCTSKSIVSSCEEYSSTSMTAVSSSLHYLAVCKRIILRVNPPSTGHVGVPTRSVGTFDERTCFEPRRRRGCYLNLRPVGQSKALMSARRLITPEALRSRPSPKYRPGVHPPSIIIHYPCPASSFNSTCRPSRDRGPRSPRRNCQPPGCDEAA